MDAGPRHHPVCSMGDTAIIVNNAAGTNAMYRNNPLERYFHDIHVAVQHAAALPLHLEAAGKVLLGHPLQTVGG